MDDNNIIVKSTVKHPEAKKIMMELNNKISSRLGKPYKVVFED